ncbi:MAG TPA: hypothetical protein PKD27_07660, partial [Tepidiformaceae bacterium]|nr:hypothetical protein [Tepidiformaceae bacterium]
PGTGARTPAGRPAADGCGVDAARSPVPAGTGVDYPPPPGRPPRQHIVMLGGELRFTIGSETTDLGPGDALFAIIDRPTHFFVPGPAAAEYLVIQELL